MEQKITKIQEQIQLELDKSRYEHTQGVMYLSLIHIFRRRCILMERKMYETG